MIVAADDAFFNMAVPALRRMLSGTPPWKSAQIRRSDVGRDVECPELLVIGLGEGQRRAVERHDYAVSENYADSAAQ